MEWINYHHLLYFWTVAKTGSIVKASEELRLAQPTISGQIKRFEEVLGEKLFARKGRQLALTEIGRVAFRYAEEIFSLGREMQDVLKGRPVSRQPRIVVGVADAFPGLIAYLLLAPTIERLEPVTLVCREDKPERLLAELALHNLDVVLTDAPMDPLVKVRAFSHLLGECSVTFFAESKLAKLYRRGFPQSLDGAPLLMPTEDSTIRRSLDEWFNSREIKPRVVGEFDGIILLKIFGQSGMGIFPAPSVISDEIQQRYKVRPVGTLEEVRVRFYAISIEKKLKHPALIAISEEARQRIFGNGR
ncbi:MAG: transcriptional activator NhaR [Myxococcales bacterium]|nr:MAG: transcriptional activator NhaR [Myxococcales bacterium]